MRREKHRYVVLSHTAGKPDSNPGLYNASAVVLIKCKNYYYYLNASKLKSFSIHYLPLCNSTVGIVKMCADEKKHLCMPERNRLSTWSTLQLCWGAEGLGTPKGGDSGREIRPAPRWGWLQSSALRRVGPDSWYGFSRIVDLESQEGQQLSWGPYV